MKILSIRYLIFFSLFIALIMEITAADAPKKQEATVPAGIQLPLKVVLINFNKSASGEIPQGFTKEEIEKQNEDAWKSLPLENYSALSYITKTRVATVEDKPLGLEDKALLFVYEENNQPHYGPQMSIRVPYAVSKFGKKWKFSIDVSKGSVAISGGFAILDIFWVHFHEDSTVRVNKVELTQYQPNKPVHLEFILDAVEKKFTVTADRDATKTLTMPWEKPATTSLGVIRMDGLLPGGHAQAPSKIAFDNIELTMLEILK